MLIGFVSKNRTFRNVLKLMTGNLLAQIVSILAAPLLTRLYLPEDFGSLALFVAIIAVLVPGIGGRYEVASVVVAANKRKDFFFIALWLMVMLCLLFLLVLGLAFTPLSSLLKATALGGWLWLSPLALLITGIIVALRSWANAVKDYRHLSYVTIVQSVSFVLLAISIGMVGNTPDGLLLAYVIGLVITCIYLIYIFRDLFRTNDWRWSQHRWKLALRHRDFPLLSAPTNIINGIMSNLPVFFLARYYNEVMVGYYALIIRAGVAPLSFIATAVSEVNVKKISEMLESGQNPMPYFFRVTFSLLALAVPLTVLLILSAPQLFNWAFGETWRQAGVLLAILMPALAIQFVVSPLSPSFIAAGHLKLQAAWQGISLLTTLIVFAWAGRDSDIERFFWVFMIKDIVLYSLYYVMLIFALHYPIRMFKHD